MPEGGVRAWGLRVRKTDAESTRRRLLDDGLLDGALRPLAEGENIVFPLAGPCEGATEMVFPAHAPRPDLPRHEMVGGIALLPVDDPVAARVVLAARPSLHTVLFAESEVEGEFRTRRFRVLAGEPVTRTVVTEYGLHLTADLAAAYFSPRLSTERQRLAALVCPGESVVDMFAGVGPFSLTLARKAAFVVANDRNPLAVSLLSRNIHANHAGNILAVLADAARLPTLLPWRFDRVVMNLPASPVPFLPAAFRLCRPGGTIHCYLVEAAERELLPHLAPFPVERVTERYVRSYSPGRWHAAYDISVANGTCHHAPPSPGKQP